MCKVLPDPKHNSSELGIFMSLFYSMIYSSLIYVNICLYMSLYILKSWMLTGTSLWGHQSTLLQRSTSKHIIELSLFVYDINCVTLVSGVGVEYKALLLMYPDCYGVFSTVLRRVLGIILLLLVLRNTVKMSVVWGNKLDVVIGLILFEWWYYTWGSSHTTFYFVGTLTTETVASWVGIWNQSTLTHCFFQLLWQCRQLFLSKACVSAYVITIMGLLRFSKHTTL